MKKYMFFVAIVCILSLLISSCGMHNNDATDTLETIVETQSAFEELQCEHVESRWIIDEYARVDKTGKRHIECIVCGVILLSEQTPALIPSEGLLFGDNADGTSSVIGIGTCKDEDIVIPLESPNGNPINSIDAKAFYGNQKIKSVILCDNIKTVGDQAFFYCSNLVRVEMTDSVTSIGDSSFFACNRLSSVVLSTKIKSVGDSAFYGCANLLAIYLPDTVEYIGSSAFAASGLTVINIPNKIIDLEPAVFMHCSSLGCFMGVNIQLEIPKGVQRIGVGAFSYSGLTSIIIPNSVSVIEYGAFEGCDKLRDVFYTGTEEEWNLVVVGEKNESLGFANIHFNYVPMQ